MFQLSFFHIVLFFVVHMVRRKKNQANTPQKGCDTKDLIRASFEDAIGFKPFLREHAWFHLLMTLLPVYFYIQQPSIAEHICVLYIYHLCIRTAQNKINPQNTPVDFHLPFLVLSLLVSIQHNQINRRHVPHTYFAMLTYAIYHMYAKPNTTTTTSIVNDVALTHLLFFVFRAS
tara:strand:- start:101 stop:622 length:522 start_codon:yes stop_codon:yes gene_type:complete